jgi:hypothetical protein
MSRNISVASPGRVRIDATTPADDTAPLLGCGVAAGMLFVIANAIEIPTRQGFDIRRHAVSMLSLGDLGWIQVLTFTLTGVLAIAFAIGMRPMLRPGKACTWGPALVAVYGAGLLAAGIFSTDPGLGFPPGTPAGIPAMSWHGMLHSIAFFVLFTAIVSACFVVARRFWSDGQSQWALYSAATGLFSPGLISAGLANPAIAGIPFLLAAVATSMWISAVAMHLYRIWRRGASRSRS